MGGASRTCAAQYRVGGAVCKRENRFGAVFTGRPYIAHRQYGRKEDLCKADRRYFPRNGETVFRRARVAKEYEKLKLRLRKKFEFDRDAYIEAKTEFVQKYTSIAKNEGTDVLLR